MTDTGTGTRTPLRLAATVIVVVALTVAGAVGWRHRTAHEAAGTPYTLRVLAAPELRDMQPLLDRAARATGVTVKLSFAETLGASQSVVDGAVDTDAIWLATNRHISLRTTKPLLGTATNIMSSPVVLGIRTSVAHRLGWDKAQVSWTDVADAAAAHRFSFALADPSRSNDGLSALVSVATALTGSGAALEQDQIADATPQLRRLFTAQTYKGDSTEQLIAEYLRRIREGGTQIDALITYESDILALDADPGLADPLVPIAPTDGVISNQYPLTLLFGAAPGAEDAYKRLVDHLRSPDVQREIVRLTHRRPTVQGLDVEATFGRRRVYELPFPGRPAVIDALVSTYADRLRRPARTIYLLDTSGSMVGERVQQLRAALAALTGAGPAGGASLDRFRGREQVTFLPFKGEPRRPVTFDVPEDHPDATLAKIQDFARSSAALDPSGTTAIYDSLIRAYMLADGVGTGVFTSIVLLTDGENQTGRKLADFQRFRATLPPAGKAVPVFPVVFGDANIDEMRQLAATTGGRLFDGRAGELPEAFRQIRGYL